MSDANEMNVPEVSCPPSQYKSPSLSRSQLLDTEPPKETKIKKSPGTTLACSVLNALGIIPFAFRGHNLILEIQGTMPSTEQHPSRVPMWKGVKVAYTLIALCLFPLAIGGYWAYGRKISSDKDLLAALYKFRSHDVSQFVLGLTSLFVVINSVSSFQIYGMPAFDDFESLYTRKKSKPCPSWLRALIRTFFGYVNFFTAVVTPVLATTAGMVGGMTLHITLVYPCFMWIKMRKPEMYIVTWWLNWGLGLSGMCLSALVGAAFHNQIKAGVKVGFFKPQHHGYLY